MSKRSRRETRGGEPVSNAEWGNLIQSKEYWDERYIKEQGEVFEWYGGWESISPVVEDHIARDDRVLEVGCGNSGLCVDMARDGYNEIVAVDFSGAVIEELTRQHSKGSGSAGGEAGTKKRGRGGKAKDTAAANGSGAGGIQFKQMDARSLNFADASFDTCIEKATLDSMMSGEQGMETVASSCAEMSRVLRAGGVLVSVSHLDPMSEDGQLWLYEAVLPALDWKEHRWTVEVHSVEGSDDTPHIYILRKEARPYLTRSLRRHIEEDTSPPVDAQISFIEH
jgi:SAM-dependent methyltransferase